MQVKGKNFVDMPSLLTRTMFTDLVFVTYSFIVHEGLAFGDNRVYLHIS